MLHHVALAAALTAAPASLAQNLLENGSFETLDGPAPFGLPTAWILDAAAGSASSPVRTGDLSLRLDAVSSLQGSASQSDPGVGGPLISATAGETYTFRAYAQNLSANTINGTGHVAGMTLAFYDAGGFTIDSHEFIFFDGALLNPVDTWVEGELSALAPSGTAAVGVALFLHVDDSFLSQGTVYFDDASLVPAPGAVGLLALGVLGARRRR